MIQRIYSILRPVYWLGHSVGLTVGAALIFLSSTGSVSAQGASSSTTDTLRYTVEDAILTALSRNPTVTIQRISGSMTDTYRREQRALFDPAFSAGITQSDDKSQRFLGARREPFLLKTQRFQYNLGFTQSLPIGTNISMNAAISGTKSSIYTNQFTGTVGVTINQSLLQGFGLRTNLAELHKANLDINISNYEMKGVAEQVVADVERAYWELYLAGQEMAIQQSSLELAEQQLAESEERVAVGKLAQLEVASVQAEVATRREALILAQSQYEQARLQLLFLLNPAESGSWDIPVLIIEQPTIPSDSLGIVADHVKLGMMYRPDLIQARYQLEKGEIDVISTRNGLLPRLDVFITLGTSSYGENFERAKPTVGSDFYTATGGFTFSLPLFDRSERARLSRAQQSAEQRIEALHNMERMVQRDVRSAYIDVSHSRELIEASRVSRDLQDTKLAAELEMFRVGKSTNFLVLQAQRDFTLSQLAEARSLVSYLIALTNLYLMEGTLLERRHIDPGIQ